MKKTELTIGTNVGKNFQGKNIEPCEVLRKLTHTLTNLGFDAFTVFTCDGYWKGEIEKSYRVELWADVDIQIGDIRQLALDTFQDCIMVVRQGEGPLFVYSK